MSIRRIVVVLTGGDTDQDLLARTLPLAKAWKASIDGLFIRRNATSGADFMGTAFSTYGMEAVLEALDDAASAASVNAHKAFEALADEATSGVVGRFIEFVGLPAEAMAVEGRLCDLLVLARPEADPDAYNQLLVIEAAARESGRPVLVLPAELDGLPDFSTVTIAWDESLEASRAVLESLAILQAADTVRIIHAGEDGVEVSKSLSALAHYLSLHGVDTVTQMVTPDGRSIAKSLIDAASEAGAGLLVMGSFGAPVWQRVLSRDETTQVLRSAPLALLIAN
ncbi:universal stress protein [Maricaulis parjimensis]|uniref:universal stress protein n=1 Tax=Maricaulis parjimensis TaxID=144023 RepID=UPI00193A2ADE|nr:universal stress protein [Maricaulis parjimensis]